MGRACERHFRMCEEYGFTAEQAWDSNEGEMAGVKEKFGPYSQEALENFFTTTCFSGMEEFASDEKNCLVLDQTDLSDNKPIKALHKMFSIPGEAKVDKAAIEAIQY